MSKRNISYVKPQDPTFLAKLKSEIGYKEGPTVDTKRQKLQEDIDSEIAERPDRDDEQPQIVVLKSGDLTADEVLQEQQRIEREEAERPADLTQRIVFQKRKPKHSAESTESKESDKVKTVGDKKEKTQHHKEGKSKSKSKPVIPKLSFDQAEGDDQEDD